MIGKIKSRKRMQAKKKRLSKRRMLRLTNQRMTRYEKEIKLQLKSPSLMQFIKRRKTILIPMKFLKATKLLIQSIKTKPEFQVQETNNFNRAIYIFLEASFNSRKKDPKSLIKATHSRDCPTLRKPKS